jgi:ATP-dependent Lhr-like helicase
VPLAARRSERAARGPDALAALITQLEGFEAPAAAWEADILPARLDNYDFTWLDDLCLAGPRRVDTAHRAGAVAAKSAGPIRTTPVTLVPRRTLGLWNRAVPAPAEPPVTSPRATRVLEHPAWPRRVVLRRDRRRDGSAAHAGEEALAELVALGLVHSDSFSGLRALLTPSDRRKPLGDGRRRRRTALFGIEDAGRWALVRRPSASSGERRRGDAAAYRPSSRSSITSPTRCCAATASSSGGSSSARPRGFRRGASCCGFSAGSKRAARFAAAGSSPPFPASSSRCRKRSISCARRGAAAASAAPPRGFRSSAADPLNVIGSIVPGPKVPALTHNRILYRNGLPIAALVAGEVQWIETLEPRDKAEAENAWSSG